ncbi:hypothetical protein EOW77_0003625 [Bradyrhizobium yuanmingense]|uniref:hypothetical protein n=1 Tax=Bradyrhizobium yuanmingense TaxID=108015 RepID=UPI000FE33395|nr:hypothetical protein [Bradyrhizobium yuanmingense]TGN89426.1 hypothetical protein EOW77_0003625 [Bradyrhizobium yuanmingense]
MLFLATAWFLLVKPMDAAEFTIGAVEFASIDDCDAAGRKWIEELTDAAYAPRHELHWGEQRKRYAPPGASVTYTCVEREKAPGR